MTDQQAMESFESALSDRIHRYTSGITRRPFDAGATGRAAMASHGGAGSGPRWAGRRWWILLVPAAALLAIGAVVVGGLPQQDRPTAPSQPPTVVPIPDVLQHDWQRPAAIGPGGDPWGSGFLTVADGQVGYGREPGGAAATSTVAATGPATLQVVATTGTKDCHPGDAGAYGWELTGKDTVLTLTPISTDACGARQTALAGQWVRDFPPLPASGDALPAGTHSTLTFDPLADPRSTTHLEFTVPEGCRVVGDDLAAFDLQRLPDDPAGDPLAEPQIGVFVNPRLEADFAPGAACGPTGDAPGIGGGLDELVAAIVSRPGIVPTQPADVTIAGRRGRLLDLRLAPTWTGGCTDISGPVVGMPILHLGGSDHGPAVGLGPDQEVRLILVDIGEGRTLAISIYPAAKVTPTFEQHVTEAMPIVQSFKFVPAAP
jgi:hypothetical protein